jgi:hypothetical protein
VLVEFHPDIVQARDQHAGGAFHLLAVAEPAGVEAAALTALARPVLQHGSPAVSALPKICYPGVIPSDF